METEIFVVSLSSHLPLENQNLLQLFELFFQYPWMICELLSHSPLFFYLLQWVWLQVSIFPSWLWANPIHLYIIKISKDLILWILWYFMLNYVFYSAVTIHIQSCYRICFFSILLNVQWWIGLCASIGKTRS